MVRGSNPGSWDLKSDSLYPLSYDRRTVADGSVSKNRSILLTENSKLAMATYIYIIYIQCVHQSNQRKNTKSHLGMKRSETNKSGVIRVDWQLCLHCGKSWLSGFCSRESSVGISHREGRGFGVVTDFICCP